MEKKLVLISDNLPPLSPFTAAGALSKGLRGTEILQVRRIRASWTNGTPKNIYQLRKGLYRCRSTIGYRFTNAQLFVLSEHCCFFARVSLRLRPLHHRTGLPSKNQFIEGCHNLTSVCTGVCDNPVLGRQILSFLGGKSGTDHVHAGYSSGAHRYQGAPLLRNILARCARLLSALCCNLMWENVSQNM